MGTHGRGTAENARRTAAQLLERPLLVLGGPAARLDERFTPRVRHALLACAAAFVGGLAAQALGREGPTATPIARPATPPSQVRVVATVAPTVATPHAVAIPALRGHPAPATTTRHRSR